MYDVTVRYKSGKEDTFRAKSLDFSPEKIGTEDKLKEFSYRTPADRKASIFLRPSEVAEIVLNEVPDTPEPTFG